MGKRDFIEVVTSLIGGAGIGAAAMYLFDPDRGGNRRASLRQQAIDAASAAENALGSSWHSVSDSARSAGRYVADQAGDLAGHAQDHASRWGRNALDSAGDYGRQLHRRAGTYLGYNPGPSIGSISGVAAGICGALAVGAGLMFLFDPEQGRRRRTIARDKAMDYGHAAGQYVQDAAHNVADHARGAAQNVSDAAQKLKEKITGNAENAADQVEQAVQQ
jgi:gas vesicle protein